MGTPADLSTLLDSARNNFERGISLGQAAATSVMAYGVQVRVETLRRRHAYSCIRQCSSDSRPSPEHDRSGQQTSEMCRAHSLRMLHHRDDVSAT